jgi:hypothetical protein
VESRLGGLSGGPGYINTAARTPIPVIGGNGAPGTGGTGWGDSGVGVIFGPGQFNFDTTLAKITQVGRHPRKRGAAIPRQIFELIQSPAIQYPGRAELRRVGEFRADHQHLGQSAADPIGAEVRFLVGTGAPGGRGSQKHRHWHGWAVTDRDYRASAFSFWSKS